MLVGDLFDRWNAQITGQAGNVEGVSHLRAKKDIVSLIRGGRVTVIFNDGQNEIRLLAKGSDVPRSDRAMEPSSCSTELGWPGLMADCTGPSYCKKFKEYPQWIFDIGVYGEKGLCGAIEVTAMHQTGMEKATGILRAGLWFVDVSAYAVRNTEWANDYTMVEIPCDKVWMP